MSDPVADLLRFIDASPTPYHAVVESVSRLEAAGYVALDERELFTFSPGDRRYWVRGDGSLVALEIGTAAPADAGFRLLGAHTDSPNLRVKPLADAGGHGYRQLAVEPYGGVLLHTWLDRDLSLAGRVTFASAGGLDTRLVDFARPLLRVPNLAIHLQRGVAKDGLKLNPQQHALPVIGLEGAPPLHELLAEELRAAGHSGVQADDVRSFDLMTYDVQPASIGGCRDEFVMAARLDNLASCHAGIEALLRGHPPVPFTRGVVLYDHEEVGSQSAQGAGGSLLANALERCVAGFKGGAEQGFARAVARSWLVSADMAHAVHPNYADRHDPGHAPHLGGGPVIKHNAGQAYASDAPSAGLFASICRARGITPQHFASRSDLRCGSTIGPISAARVGIRTVDVGNPMLSMHSCREMAGRADVAPMIDVLAGFFAGEGEADGGANA